MTSPLISPADLKNLSSQNLVIFDCRFSLTDASMGEQQYLLGHIPGAYYLHLNRDLSGSVGKHGGRHPLPSAEAFTALMQRYGVDKESHVIAYDDQRMAFASRLWWLLRYSGHDNVQVLDGGLRAWIESGGDVVQEISAVEQTGDFTACWRDSWVVDHANVSANLDNPDRQLIDSREERRYLGLEEPIDPVAGHIPGAGNFPWQEVTDESGRALPPVLQKKRWEDLPDDKELIVYCGSGVTACVNLLSLQLAGIDKAKLYAGSWSDWCSYITDSHS